MDGKSQLVCYLDIFQYYVGWTHKCRKLILDYSKALQHTHAIIIIVSSQVIKNYRLRDAEGLSFTFLTVWLTGKLLDVLNCGELVY